MSERPQDQVDQGALTSPRPTASGWTLSAATGILACLAIKSLVNVQVIPFWGGTDPMREAVIDVGLKPSQVMILDAVVLLCAAVLIALGKGASSRLWMLAAGASVVASGWIVHGVTRGAHDPTIFEQEMMASSWISGLAAMLGLWRGAAQAGVRWLGVSVFSGLCLALVMKGGLQIFIEHPQMVQNFKANREAIFAANGWLSDSAAARGYERRIMQAEASGFTGFSNVTASFLLAGLAGLSGLMLALVLGLKSRLITSRSDRTSRWRVWVMMVAAVACGLGVVWTGSKAGQLLAIVGTAVSLLSVWWLRRVHLAHEAKQPRTRLINLGQKVMLVMPIGLSLAVVLGVVVRGLIGERIGELSVLFRWHYLIGAGRAFAREPIFGTGIDGFQGAYAQVKVPFSPEDVSSPHFQIAEWIAVLGVGGLAMGCMVVIALVACGIGLRRGVEVETPSATDLSTYLRIPERWMMRSAVLLAAVVTLASLHVMREALTGGELMLRLGVLLALVLGVKFVVGLLEEAADGGWLDWLDSAGRLALVIFAALLVAHSQFELTGTNTQTAGLVLAMLGLAAGAVSKPSTTSEQIKPPATHLALRGLAAACAAILAMGCVLVQQAFSEMESQLARSAQAWNTVREIQENLGQAMRKRDPAAAELGAMLQQATAKALTEHRTLEDLRWWIQPRGYWPMARSSSQSLLVIARQIQQMAQQAAMAGQQAQASALQARAMWLIAGAERAVLMPYDVRKVQEAIDFATGDARSPLPPPALSPQEVFDAGRTKNVTRLAWLGAVYEEWARQTSAIDPARAAADFGRAIQVATEAAELEPYSLQPAMKVLRLAVANGDRTLAQTWAREVLKRNDLQRLDAEVRGLTGNEKAEVDRILSVQ